MEINISDYLSQSQMEDIVADELRRIVNHKLSSDSEVQRIIGNAAYYKAYDILDNAMPEDWAETVTSKVKEVVNDAKSYNIFRYDWSTNMPESKASRIVEQTVVESKDKIITQVNEILDEKVKADANTFVERLIDSFYNSFTVKFERGDR